MHRSVTLHSSIIVTRGIFNITRSLKKKKKKKMSPFFKSILLICETFLDHQVTKIKLAFIRFFKFDLKQVNQNDYYNFTGNGKRWCDLRNRVISKKKFHFMTQWASWHVSLSIFKNRTQNYPKFTSLQHFEELFRMKFPKKSQ